MENCCDKEEREEKKRLMRKQSQACFIQPSSYALWRARRRGTGAPQPQILHVLRTYGIVSISYHHGPKSNQTKLLMPFSPFSLPQRPRRRCCRRRRRRRPIDSRTRRWLAGLAMRSRLETQPAGEKLSGGAFIAGGRAVLARALRFASCVRACVRRHCASRSSLTQSCSAVLYPSASTFIIAQPAKGTGHNRDPLRAFPVPIFPAG